MNIFNEILRFFILYPSSMYWTVLIASLLGGEEILIFFSLLAGYGIINIWKLSLIGFLGILVADIVWFWFARTSIFELLKNKVKKYSHYKHANALVERFSHKHDFVYLFLTKFVYGLRIVSIMKVSRRGKHFFKFLISDSLAIISWGIIVMPLGFVLGRTFFSAINILDDANKLFILGLLVLAVLFLIERVIRDRLEK